MKPVAQKNPTKTLRARIGELEQRLSEADMRVNRAENELQRMTTACADVRRELQLSEARNDELRELLHGLFFYRRA